MRPGRIEGGRWGVDGMARGTYVGSRATGHKALSFDGSRVTMLKIRQDLRSDLNTEAKLPS